MSGRKKKPLSMVEIYLNYKKAAIAKYGTNTAVLMQVGSFYELYEIDNDISDPSSIGRITELMDIKLTIRGGTVPSYKTPWFAGVPMEQIEKFSQRLTDNGYRVVLVSHTGELDETNRESRAISRILSAGTTLTPGSWSSNWILTIYMESNKTSASTEIDIGVALVDVSTGEVQIAEFISKQHDIQAELHKIVHAKNPCELVLFVRCEQDPFSFIREAQLDKIPNRIYYKNDIPEQVSKSTYRTKLLEKIHGPTGAADLWKKPLGTIAYVGTIAFCAEHYSQLITEFDEPVLYESDSYMSLYNNALMELDIWHEHSKRSLFNVINFTHTAMGTRLLKERLVQPITDPIELQRRYTLIRRFIEHNNTCTALKDLVDLKRYQRRLHLGSIPPTDIVRLDRSYTEIDEMFTTIDGVLNMEEQGWLNLTATIKLQFKEMIQYYRSVFILEKMSGVVEIEENVHHKGVSPTLDKMQEELEMMRQAFSTSAARLTGILLESKSTGSKNNGEVTVEYKDKFGYYLSTTRARFNKISKHPDCIINGFYVDDETPQTAPTKDKEKDKESPDSDDESVKRKPRSAADKQGKVRIVSAALKQASSQIILLQEQFKRLGREVYLEELRKWGERYKSVLERVSNIVSAIDVAQASAMMATTYGYVEPIINITSAINDSFITATELRHPIVERLVKGVQYIGNDISLNRESNTGIILYGLNGGGKTVLSKSVAVNLIMAQAGLYVAAKTFEYVPYTKLFTRIGGMDNMFNGESSFTLEMNELRSILKYADNRSLMIGDEICRGTEPVSAMAIVGAAVKKFAETGVQFIFATHLHKLVDLTDIRAIPNICVKHLHVEVTADNLIYHRKLKDGPGPGLYGLEVMQFLIKDLGFKGVAQRIRNEVLEMPDLPLNVKRSRYNPDLFVHQCEVCGVPYTATQLDVHHIRYQCTFEDGPIDAGLHKDQLSNLVVLCKKHHQDVHAGTLVIQGWQDTINGRKLQFNPPT